MNSKYVVFVEDEAVLHRVYREVFKKPARNLGFNLECFDNGQECFNFVNERQDSIEILLIVTDIVMPVMDGFELLERMKQSFPHIKIFATSANTDKDTTEKVYELGAEKFLGKPLDFSYVLDEIEKHFVT